MLLVQLNEMLQVLVLKLLEHLEYLEYLKQVLTPHKQRQRLLLAQSLQVLFGIS